MNCPRPRPKTAPREQTRHPKPRSTFGSQICTPTGGGHTWREAPGRVCAAVSPCPALRWTGSLTQASGAPREVLSRGSHCHPQWPGSPGSPASTTGRVSAGRWLPQSPSHGPQRGRAPGCSARRRREGLRSSPDAHADGGSWAPPLCTCSDCAGRMEVPCRSDWGLPEAQEF